MTKRFFRFSLLLALVIGCILFIQWKGYTTQRDQAASNIEQTFSIRHTHDGFNVKQVIRELPKGTYSIHFPEGSKESDCRYEDNKTCEWGNGKDRKLKINEKPVIFTYTLKTPPEASNYLLENWGVKIKEAPSIITRVQLTESNWRKGSWVAGAELSGKEKMEALDYYVFESDDGLPPLYWQDRELVQREMNSNLIIYEDGKSSLNSSVFEKVVPSEKKFVIITDHTKRLVEKGPLIIFPDSKRAGEQLTRVLVDKKLSFQKGEEWYTELIASLLLGKPAENNKVEKMRKTITSLLTEEQLERWLENILSAETKTSSAKLDDLLGDTANIKTDFFQKNAVKSRPYQPFYFMDKRDVYIDGSKADDIKILVQKDRTYIMFPPLVEKLGFQVLDKSKPEEMKIKKDGDIYHFTFTQKLFTLNGKQFGFRKNPFIMNQNEVYLDTAALSAIFGLEITENGNKINIK